MRDISHNIQVEFDEQENILLYANGVAGDGTWKTRVKKVYTPKYVLNALHNPYYINKLSCISFLSDLLSNKVVSFQCLRSNTNRRSRPWEKYSDMLVIWNYKQFTSTEERMQEGRLWSSYKNEDEKEDTSPGPTAQGESHVRLVVFLEIILKISMDLNGSSW